MHPSITRNSLLLTTCVLLTLMILGSPNIVVAQQAGQADLDEATSLKFDAETMADLERVIELCESAIEKGIDKDNEELAKSLLTATLYQHATRFAQAIFNPRDRAQRPAVLKQFAMSDLEKALKYDDNLPQVHLLIARLEALRFNNQPVSKESQERGMRSAGRAVELYANDKEKLSRALLARAGFQPDIEDRMKDLDRAIEIDPTNVDAWRIRALTRLVQSRVLAANGKVEEAEAARRKSLEDFMKLLEENSEDMAALQAVAELTASFGDFDEAIEFLNSAIKLNPKTPSAYVLRAKVYIAQQKLDEAIADYNRAIDLSPGNYELLLERSQIHLAKGDAAAASADVDKVLEIEPNFLTALRQRSLIAMSNGNYDDAARDLEKVIKALELRDTEPNPSVMSDLRTLLGQCYQLAGDPAKSVEIFTQVLADKPEDVTALRYRGDGYLSLGEQAKAIADYETAKQLEPANDVLSGILNNLAWVLATSPDEKLRDGKRAVELAEKASELTNYNQAHILSTLAAAHAETGDFEKAKEWSEKAVEMTTDSDQLDPETAQQLANELESYRQKKPWRERQGTDADADEEAATEKADQTDPVNEPEVNEPEINEAKVNEPEKSAEDESSPETSDTEPVPAGNNAGDN